MATDYRQLCWGGTASLASSVKWVNGNSTVYPAVVKWGTDTVFARAMDVTMTTKTGISSISYTFTAGDVSAAISRGTYGFFWGDTFTATPVAASWWTVTPASKTVVLNSNYFDLSSSTTPSTLYMRDFFTASRLARTLSVTGDEHVQVTGDYINTSNNSATVTTKSTTTKTVADAWQGATVTFSATTDAYWKINTSSGIGAQVPGTATLAASATSTRKLRTIKVTKNANITAITVSYTNSSGTAASQSFTANGSITQTWSGAIVTYIASAEQYWSTSGGTIREYDNEMAVTVSPIASRLARTIKLLGDAHTIVTISYTNTSGNAAYDSTTTTTVTKNDVFQGATATTSALYAQYWKKSTESNIGSIAPGAAEVFATATSTRKLRDVTVTKNANIAAITVSYANSSGTETSQSFTSSGTISDTYSGHKVSYTAAAATYWTTTGSGSIAEADNEDTVTISPTASRAPRKVQFTTDTHSKISVVYTNTSNVPNQVYTANNSSTFVGPTDLWQGATCTVTASANTYYSINFFSGSTGTIAAGTSSIVASAQSRMKTRSITFTKNDGIDSAKITWYSTDVSGSTTATPTSSGSVTTSSFSGQAIEVTPNATQYWSAPGTYTISAVDNETTINVNPTATRLPRTITLLGDAHATVSLSYTNTHGDPASGSATTTTVTKNDVFQGAAATTTVTYAPYWKKSAESNIGTIATGTSSIVASAQSRIKTRSISFTKKDGIDSVTVTWYSTDASGATTATPNVSGSVTTSSFSGKPIDITPNAATYWSAPDAFTIEAADNEAAIYVNPTATEKKRVIGAILQNGIDSITIQYKPSSSAIATVTVTSNGVVTDSSFSGGKVTWSAAASDYFTLDTSSGEIAAADNTERVLVMPAAGTKLTRSAGVTRGGYWTMGISAATMYYVSSTGTDMTRISASIPTTGTGNYTKTVWQGGEVTFAISARNGWTFTAPAAIEPGSTTVRRTVNPHVIPDRLDVCSEGTFIADDTVSITIHNYTGYALSNFLLSGDTYAYDSGGSFVDYSGYSLPNTISAGGSGTAVVDFEYPIQDGEGTIILRYVCNGTYYECEIFAW